MSAAKSSKMTVNKIAKASMVSPMASTMVPAQGCGCSNCCSKQTATICFTIDTSFLQNLVNMFPKINVTSQSASNCDCDCDECAEDETNP